MGEFAWFYGCVARSGDRPQLGRDRPLLVLILSELLLEEEPIGRVVFFCELFGRVCIPIENRFNQIDMFL